MEIVPYGGWNRCLRLVVGQTEALLTLEVGPRIIRYGVIGGPNELVEYQKDMGKTGGDEYRSYGGHRLWIAPEENPKTMHSDNQPVDHREEDGSHILTAPTEKWFAQKELRVKVEGEAIRIEHRIYNRGVYPLELAPWALTVMAIGGTCLFPQSEFIAHSDKVLPARPLVLWHYTDMSDPRWTWGKTVTRLEQHTDRGPQKLGAFVEQGYAAYANHGNLFLKRFDAEPEFEYPDYGCNFEAFTRQDMLEVETLGPLESIPPGDFASHWETWYLIPGATPPQDDFECGKWLSHLASSRPLLK
jgi:hypothetical protein